MTLYRLLGFAGVLICATSCASLKAVKRGDYSGLLTAPFELADDILDTTSVLEGRQPSWVKAMPQTYTDATSGAKAVFPRGYNYGSITWTGSKDDKGYAHGQGTTKVYVKSGGFSFSETGAMSHGKWEGTTKETDKEGKDWKCVWNDGEQASRERIYTQAELAQQRRDADERSKRRMESLDRFGRWLGNAMASRSSSSGSSYSSSSSSGSTSTRTASGQYEDCRCTYDARKGESRGSGYNTIRLRSSSGSWTVSYYFGGGNYLMSGSGNLEGKSVNVRFDGGRPASLKCSYGTGYCRVESARRD